MFTGPITLPSLMSASKPFMKLTTKSPGSSVLIFWFCRRQAMTLKELPHHLGGVDFLSRPRVAESIDADHSDLGAVTATGVAHRRQGPGRIFQNDFRIAAVVGGPARECVRNTLQPLVTAAFGMSVV